MPRKKFLKAPGEFLGGIIIGASLTYILFLTDSSTLPVSPRNSLTGQVELISKSTVTQEESNEEEVTWPVPISRTNPGDAVASRLKKTVRILCCVMATPDGLEGRVVRINATWGHRCNTLLFMISKTGAAVANDHLSVPIVHLDIPGGRTNPLAKTQAAFKYITRHHLRDTDWVFVADDETFAVVENLRYLLKDQRSRSPVYLGRRFKHSAGQGYMSGGAGYVLSRAAVRTFLIDLARNPNLCQDKFSGAEDVLLGVCLEKCGVKAMDTRDAAGRQRFHPRGPWDYLLPGQQSRDVSPLSHDYYPTEWGPECCSDYTVTFGYMPPDLMYLSEFLLYHLKPFGIEQNCDLLEDI